MKWLLAFVLIVLSAALTLQPSFSQVPMGCGVPGRPPCPVAPPIVRPPIAPPGVMPPPIARPVLPPPVMPPPVARPVPPPVPWGTSPRSLPANFVAPAFAPPPYPPIVLWTNRAPTPPAVFNDFDTSLLVNFPAGAQDGSPPLQQNAQIAGGITLATPPVPNLSQLDSCYSDSNSEDDFYECAVEKAFPAEYRLASDCLQKSSDELEALICSTGDSRLSSNYERFKNIKECFDTSSASERDIALCAGSQFLGQNERYYLSCITNNPDSYANMAVCALGRDMNPEWQIAASCALMSGGQPYAFAACAGGQLTARELEKCWQHGIATNNGCFGPNNEFRKLASRLDDGARQIFGQNSAVYQAYHWYTNNVMAPGPNHEVVKAFNTVLHDVTQGPGPNNDIVKFVNQLPQAKIGNVRICVPWC